MLEIIKEYASKGLYIGLYPIYENKEYNWVSYVMINGKREWLKGDKGYSVFSSPELAFNSAIEYAKEKEKSSIRKRRQK